jgi:hypothetical protein
VVFSFLLRSGYKVFRIEFFFNVRRVHHYLCPEIFLKYFETLKLCFKNWKNKELRDTRALKGISDQNILYEVTGVICLTKKGEFLGRT